MKPINKIISECKSTAYLVKQNERIEALKSYVWKTADSSLVLVEVLVKNLPPEEADKVAIEIENLIYEIVKIRVAAE